MGLLTLRALNGLRDYKYKPGGYTFLDVIHTPFWDWLTARLPMWLAPNLITLTGLIGVIISYCVTAWYLPDFTGEAPAWVLVMNAVAVVVYVNLDCIDGKQARRTKSSSPLGQLFDHGCDALCVGLLLGNTQVAIGSPCGPLSAVMQMALMVPWCLAHVEEYHTGNLLYGNGLFGVLEANYALAGLSLVSAALGVHVWDTKVGSFIPLLPGNLGDYDLRHAFFVLAVVGCVSNLLGQLGRLLGVLACDPLPADERGFKQLGRLNVLLHLAIMGLLIGLGMLWQADVDALEHKGQCRLASATYGLSYALVNSQMIMAHMAKEPFTPSVWAIAMVALGALNSVFHWLPIFPFTLVLGLVTLLGYLRYVSGVVEQVCEHLHIKCFTIKHAATKQ